MWPGVVVPPTTRNRPPRMSCRLAGRRRCRIPANGRRTCRAVPAHREAPASPQIESEGCCPQKRAQRLPRRQYGRQGTVQRIVATSRCSLGSKRRRSTRAAHGRQASPEADSQADRDVIGVCIGLTVHCAQHTCRSRAITGRQGPSRAAAAAPRYARRRQLRPRCYRCQP